MKSVDSTNAYTVIGIIKLYTIHSIWWSSATKPHFVLNNFGSIVHNAEVYTKREKNKLSTQPGKFVQGRSAVAVPTPFPSFPPPVRCCDDRNYCYTEFFSLQSRFNHIVNKWNFDWVKSTKMTSLQDIHTTKICRAWFTFKEIFLLRQWTDWAICGMESMSIR